MKRPSVQYWQPPDFAAVLFEKCNFSSYFPGKMGEFRLVHLLLIAFSANLRGGLRMSRIQSLLQELTPGARERLCRHPAPDFSRPLRMQVTGRTPARRRMIRCRIDSWKRALTSPDAWRRAAVITLLAIALMTAAQLKLRHIIFLSTATAVIALASGAWAEVSLTAMATQSQNN